MIEESLQTAAAEMEDSEVFQRYAERHGIEATSVLTVTSDETADLIASSLAPRIAGKTVIEIGGGIGILSLHMGFIAKRVFCIESNPMWTSAFIASLFAGKLKNVSYLFGAADEFVGHIKGDVALFCTHSGVASMKRVAADFAPEVIDVYGEILASNAKKFDKLAMALRGIS